MGVLLLVRHGQASFGADDYDVLSDTGWEQGRELGRWLARTGPAPATVVHGGLRRHRETWAAVAEGAEWGIDARVDADWDEFDHLAVIDRHPERLDGDLDRRPFDVRRPDRPDARSTSGTSAGRRESDDRRQFQAVFEAATARWIAGEDDGYPETYDGFVARARRALARAAERPGPTLVVTSGGVVAAVAATLVVPPAADAAVLGHVWGRFNTVVANSSVTRVIVGATGARLLTFNEHPHLTQDLLTYR